MGDRWILDMACGRCGVINHEVWYAPTCGSEDFICVACGVTNQIVEQFVAVPEPDAAPGGGE